MNNRDYVNSISLWGRMFEWDWIAQDLKSRFNNLNEDIRNEKISHEQIYSEQQVQLSEALAKIGMLEEQIKLMKAKLKNIRDLVKD